MAAGPNDENLRHAQRLAVTPRCEVLDGTTTIKALIQDVSDEGMLLVCSKIFTPGQKLGLKLLLSASQVVECTVEVRHSNDMGTGLKIEAMDGINRRVYDVYLQEYFSQQLGKLG